MIDWCIGYILTSRGKDFMHPKGQEQVQKYNVHKLCRNEVGMWQLGLQLLTATGLVWTVGQER